MRISYWISDLCSSDLAGVVEKDRPALLEIAGADGDDARRIDAAEHRLSGDCDRLDQRLAGIARQDELRALALRRGPVDRYRVLRPCDAHVAGQRLSGRSGRGLRKIGRAHV